MPRSNPMGSIGARKHGPLASQTPREPYHGSMPVIRMIFQSTDTKLGEFHCWPGDPLWTEENTVGSGYHVVFPGTGVRITHEGGRPIVTNPNHVVFYNDGQAYRRQLVSRAGDHCVFLIPSDTLLREALAEFRPEVAGEADLRFPFTNGPTDQATYLLHREVVRFLLAQGSPDSSGIREALYVLIRHAIARASGVSLGRRARRPSTDRIHADMVEATKDLITRRFTQRLSLGELARAVHASPYHLARVFRDQTGFTVFGYLNQLRLRTALERLTEPSADLARLAVDLGFSSHSHFTDRFRGSFGVTPSSLRPEPQPNRLVQMRKMLEASPGLAR
jgi:AraC family transcriptional regulator